VKSKGRLALAITTLIILVVAGIFLLRPTSTPADQEFVGQIAPEESEFIANSWNPPRNSECATIISAIAAVVIDKSLTDPDEITNSIIRNTRLAAARLSLLTQQSKDKEIINWSYKSAGILVKFEAAIKTKNELAVKGLYDQIGSMVENPPVTCDNTKSERL